MTDSEVLTRRGMLVLLGGGGVMAGVAMTGLGEPPGGEPPGDETATVGPAATTEGTHVVAAVTSATRSRRAEAADARSAAHQHGAAHGSGAAAPHAGADQLWSDVVRVGLRVDNVTDHAVLLSPGQFRLRVEELGLTVAPMAAQRVAGPLQARAASDTWIEYLAPGDAGSLALEFTDFGRVEAVTLPFVAEEVAR